MLHLYLAPGWRLDHQLDTTACSISGAARFFRIGFWRVIFCRGQLATTFVVQLPEAIEAVAAVPHYLIILQAWLTLRSCLASTNPSDSASFHAAL